MYETGISFKIYALNLNNEGVDVAQLVGVLESVRDSVLIL